MISRKMKLFSICIWYFVYVYKSTSAFTISIFEGQIFERNNQSIIEFTCKINQRPIDDSIVFLLNEQTSNVMRFLDGKCHNTYEEDTECKCFLSQNKMTFTWVYIMHVPGNNCTFGTEMSITNDENGNTMNVNLYRRYNGKDLGPLLFDLKEFYSDTTTHDGLNVGLLIGILICLVISITGVATICCLLGKMFFVQRTTRLDVTDPLM